MSQVHDKAFDFAVRIVKLTKYLKYTKKELYMADQLLRCGTSIGANLAEAASAMSKKDFLAKAYISFKECSETKFWLKVLYTTDYLTDEEYNSINADCIELQKLLSAITKTTRNNLGQD